MTSKRTREVATTIETVALTHHSFVALAQLSAPRIAMVAGARVIVGMRGDAKRCRARSRARKTVAARRTSDAWRVRR